MNDAELLNVLDYVAGEARFLECFITSSYCKDERVNVDFLTSSLLKMAAVDAIDWWCSQDKETGATLTVSAREPLNMCKGLNVDDTRDYWLKEGSGIF